MQILKYDILIILFALVVCGLFIWLGFYQSKESGYLNIEDSTGKSIYPLSEDRDVVLKGVVGKSVVRIKNGEACFQYADCPDDVCIQMGRLSHSGDWAACLPNRVFIHIGDDLK